MRRNEGPTLAEMKFFPTGPSRDTGRRKILPCDETKSRHRPKKILPDAAKSAGQAALLLFDFFDATVMRRKLASHHHTKRRHAPPLGPATAQV